MANISNENFWNELTEKYPDEMLLFSSWIDQYKRQVGWNKLFNSDSEYQNAEGKNAVAPKFHNIPLEMQMGVVMVYLGERYGEVFDSENYTHRDVNTAFTEEVKILFQEISEQATVKQNYFNNDREHNDHSPL